MRREGFELQVSAPQVIFKEENGQRTEPIEHVIINVDEESSGMVIDIVAKKKGQMTNMSTLNGIATLEFEVPTRGLLGFRSQFVLMTKGEGIMYNSFSHYAPYKGDIPKRTTGSMISQENGKCMKYSIWKLQERGKIFILPGSSMYEGMIVGESAKPGDMVVNLTKNKQQTNVRESGNDEAMRLAPIITLTLEDSLAYISTDEYVEITPKNIRLRKIYLTDSDRKKAGKFV
jgi:GTP-binding protein